MIPTIVISIVTIAVFATSVYGIVKAANLNSSIDDIPEVESIDDIGEVSPTPSPQPEEEIEEDEQEDLITSPTPTVLPTDDSQPEVRRKDDSEKSELDNNLEDAYDDDREHPKTNKPKTERSENNDK